jgi:uncharacterized membrane protein (UPF0182 family)
MRAAAALHFGDSNIVLTGYLTDHSRMMIHRRVRERLQTLAPYLNGMRSLSGDYAGRPLVWMVDGYTTSDSHPFSREIEAYGGINYIRNAVKATIDAYDGETHLYVFDPADPVIGAYRTLFPTLYEDVSKMPERPARAHAVSRGNVPRAGDVYRVYHMRIRRRFITTKTSGNWRSIRRARTPSRSR